MPTHKHLIQSNIIMLLFLSAVVYYQLSNTLSSTELVSGR